MKELSGKELSGKCAIITGASRGIGESTARLMAGIGVSVVLAARSEDRINQIAEEIQNDGGTACAVKCDVSRYEDVQRLIDECVTRYGQLNILVNNAGVIEPIGHLIDSDPEAWSHAFDINLKGVYYGLRAALPVMRSQESGVIVNVSSGAAHHPLEGWSHYSSAKAAAAMLTRATHLENHESGIRVLGLSPGTVATQMQVLIKASGINPVSQLDPSVHIDPSWPAQVIAWACTSAASQFDGEEISLRDENVRKLAGLA